MNTLSQRESEILQLAAEGLTDKEIAVRTGLSTATIRTYWDRIKEKLKAINRAHATALHMQPKMDEMLGSAIVRAIDHVAIFIVSRENKLCTWNAGVEKLFGYGEKEWVGQDGSLFFVPEDRETHEPEKEIEAAIKNTEVAAA